MNSVRGLRESEASLALARHEFRRAEKLARRESVSQSELDRARSELRVAEARVQLRQVELDRTEIRAPFEGLVGARMVSPGDRVDEKSDLVRIDSVDDLDLILTIPEVALRLAKVGLQMTLSVVAWPGEDFPAENLFRRAFARRNQQATLGQSSGVEPRWKVAARDVRKYFDGVGEAREGIDHS